MKREKFKIEILENYSRLDLYISNFLKILNRNQIKRRSLKAFYNEREVKLSKNVFKGQRLLIEFDQVSFNEEIEPEDLKIDVIFEDENLIAIDKPQGIVSHPALNNFKGTVVNWLFFHIKNFQNNFSNQTLRPGIVHRLDKDTSGLLLCAKNLSTLNFLSNKFKEREVSKIYIAIVKGTFNQNEGIIKNYIARDKFTRKKFRVVNYSNSAKEAITEWKALLNFNNKYTLVLLKPKTGRTHQLRVHMNFLNKAILGDPLYSRVDSLYKNISLMLHSFKMKLEINEGDFKVFTTDFPLRFKEFLSHFYENSQDLTLAIELIERECKSFL